MYTLYGSTNSKASKHGVSTRKAKQSKKLARGCHLISKQHKITQQTSTQLTKAHTHNSLAKSLCGKLRLELGTLAGSFMKLSMLPLAQGAAVECCLALRTRHLIYLLHETELIGQSCILAASAKHVISTEVVISTEIVLDGCVEVHT